MSGTSNIASTATQCSAVYTPAAVLFQEIATSADELASFLSNCESIDGSEWAVLHAFIGAIGAAADKGAAALGGIPARSGSAEWLLSPAACEALQKLRKDGVADQKGGRDA